MRSSLACAARVALPLSSRLENALHLRTRSKRTYPQQHPPRVSSSRPPQSLGGGGRSRTSDKIQHLAYEAPLSTHRYPRRRTSLFAFPMISTAISRCVYSDWISVRKRLIVNAIVLGNLHKDTIMLYRISEITIFMFEYKILILFDIFYFYKYNILYLYN